MPRINWKSRWLSPRLTAAAVALVATAVPGLSTGTAVAKPGPHGGHDSPGHQWHWPGHGGKPGHGHTPNITVPGIDTTVAPQDLAPPPITVLQDNPGTAPGAVFAGPKIVTPGTPGQQGPEIIDNEGQPYFFLPITCPTRRAISGCSSTGESRSSPSTSARAPVVPATAPARA